MKIIKKVKPHYWNPFALTCPDCGSKHFTETIDKDGAKHHACVCGYLMVWKHNETKN